MSTGFDGTWRHPPVGGGPRRQRPGSRSEPTRIRTDAPTAGSGRPVDRETTTPLTGGQGLTNWCKPGFVAKHLIDVDEKALGAARAELGTRTIKDTVNEALRRVRSGRERRVVAALDVLAGTQLDDRDDAWR